MVTATGEERELGSTLFLLQSLSVCPVLGRQGFTCFRMDSYVHNNAFDEDGDNIVIK